MCWNGGGTVQIFVSLLVGGVEWSALYCTAFTLWSRFLGTCYIEAGFIFIYLFIFTFHRSKLGYNNG